MWRTSSRSATNGNCVEVGWRLSSRTSENGNCVEVAVGDPVHVRDSMDRGGPTLTFTPGAWRQFVADVGAGDYDLEATCSSRR